MRAENPKTTEADGQAVNEVLLKSGHDRVGIGRG